MQSVYHPFFTLSFSNGTQSELTCKKRMKQPALRGLSKKFVQYVYKNFILQILGYINMVPFKILPIRHNTLVPSPFPLLEAPLEFLFS